MSLYKNKIYFTGKQGLHRILHHRHRCGWCLQDRTCNYYLNYNNVFLYLNYKDYRLTFLSEDTSII